MQINTKYNHGDKVFVMIQNMVAERIVDAIGMTEWPNNINYPMSSYIYYMCRNSTTKEVTRHSESSLFATKEALLQSL